jgi:hypothetical protein
VAGFHPDFMKVRAAQGRKRPRHGLAEEPDSRVADFDIGAHAPKLADEDVNLINRLWLDVTK